MKPRKRVWELREPCVIFDTETTGTQIDIDRVVEIGGLKVDANGDIIDTFEQRVNPGVHIPAAATAIHGIADADVVGCPDTVQALSEFFFWGGDSVYTAYNLKYDEGILNAELDRHDFYPGSSPTWRFDTLQLTYRLIYPGKPGEDLLPSQKIIKDYRLSTVAAALGVDTQGAHGAIADCRMALSILKHCFQQFKDRYPWQDFKKWMETPYWLPFWVWKKGFGTRLRDMPVKDLLWASRVATGDLKFSIEKNLKGMGY